MTGLILISFLCSIGFPVHHLPAISPTSDILVVMMEDGLLPEEPWDGMSSYQREEFWALGCSGMMLQRAAWSGYIIICPMGIGEEILDTAKDLGAASGAVDMSSMSTGLKLEPLCACSSTVILFSAGGTDQEPLQLPLRGSSWLEEEPDTVMISSAEEGNAFFWTGHPEDVDLTPSLWRGTGTEVVPCGGNSVRLSHSCVHGSVPSNLLGIVNDSHPMDDYFMETWGSALIEVDSLIAGIYPLREDADHLLWIRGSGTERPWRTASSPLPPPSAQYEVTMPVEPCCINPSRELEVSSIPNARSIQLPGRLEDISRAPVIETVLERTIVRILPAVSGENVHFDVQLDPSGTFRIWLITDDGSTLEQVFLDSILDAVEKSVLVPPGQTLLHNASVRASYIEGELVDTVDVREASMELMNLLYPE